MSTEPDELMQRVLEDARDAVEPGPEELARALAGVRRRLAAPASGVARDGGVTRAGRPGAVARALRGAGHLRWFAALAAAGLAGVAGFGLGVQHGRELEAASARSAVLARAPGAARVLAAQASVPDVAAPPEATGSGAHAAAAPHDPASALQAAASERATLPTPERAALAASKRDVPGTAEHGPDAGRRARSEGDAPAARGRALRPASRTTRAPARHAGSAASLPAFSFEQVLDRLARAQRAQRRSEPALALALLDELDAGAERALLREERLVLRVLAACDADDVAQAERAAAELGASEEASAYASRLAESCARTAVGHPSAGASSR